MPGMGSQLERRRCSATSSAAPSAARSRRTRRSSSGQLGLRQETTTFLNNAIVPTAQERDGRLQGSRTIPTDPATGCRSPATASRAFICGSRLDPAAMKIINDYIPLVERPRQHMAGLHPDPYDTDEFLIKVDTS